jgi:hypothetical protein
MTMKKLSMMGSVALFVLGGCVADETGQDPAESKPLGATPQQKSTRCAVGTQPNDSLAATSDSPAGYARSATVIDSSDSDDCDCSAWQDDYNAELALGFSKGSAEDLATDLVKTCRPFTWLQVNVKSIGDNGMLLGASVDDWGATTKAECDASEVLLGVDQLVNGTWQPFYPSTTKADDYEFAHPMFATLGGCLSDGLSVPVTQIGTYRIKAKGILGAESDGNGYTNIKLSAAPPPTPPH